MKTTNKSTVDYVDSMGTDLTVCNAARVSFDKESQWEVDELVDVGLPGFRERVLSEKDEKLIRYLALHNHWSPFAHTSIQLRISAPIFVARQLVKHQVGGVWNEVSRRYVDDEPVFYFPEVWRKRAENKKQGSSDESVEMDENDPYMIESTVQGCENTYNYLLDIGVAPEQARMLLPQNMMTSWYWTGSLMFFYRVWKQRIDSHAQVETQEVAKQIGSICNSLFPVSWKCLTQTT